jgi:hypothetical protein
MDAEIYPQRVNRGASCGGPPTVRVAVGLRRIVAVGLGPTVRLGPWAYTVRTIGAPARVMASCHKMSRSPPAAMTSNGSTRTGTMRAVRNRSRHITLVSAARVAAPRFVVSAQLENGQEICALSNLFSGARPFSGDRSCHRQSRQHLYGDDPPRPWLARSAPANALRLQSLSPRVVVRRLPPHRGARRAVHLQPRSPAGCARALLVVVRRGRDVFDAHIQCLDLLVADLPKPSMLFSSGSLLTDLQMAASIRASRRRASRGECPAVALSGR